MKSQGRSKALVALLAAAIVAVLLPATAGAEETAQPAAPPAKETVRQVTPSGDALVIRWNPTIRQMEQPSAEVQNKIMAERKQWLAERFGEGPDKVWPAPEKLASGMVKVRVPLSELNASIVRVGADGELVRSCVEGEIDWQLPATSTASTPSSDK